MLQDFFKKAKYITVPQSARAKSTEQNLPPDMWHLCPKCSKGQLRDEYERGIKVCPHCGHHERLGAWERISITADSGSFNETDSGLHSVNPLDFDGYSEKILSLNKSTGLEDAVITGRALIEGTPLYLGVMDSHFMMASMGSVVGERLTRMFERATDDKLPVVLFCASGGARMQEGILSLMQMAKVSAAVGRHSAAGGLYIPVLTDPTTGGVTASFAMLGDIQLAEPGATIGFAGRRVIEGTISEKLPADFQTSEFQLAHGFIDAIVPRKDMRHQLGYLLKIHSRTSNNVGGVSVGK